MVDTGTDVAADRGGAHQRIADLARMWHGRDVRASGTHVADAVAQDMVDVAVEEIPGATYAGITLATSRSEVSTPASTHPYPALLDTVQQRHRQGPCLSAAEHEHVVRVTDLRTEVRWPFYRRDALKLTPIRSVLSFRMFTADDSMGALNIFSERPDAFDARAEVVGYVLATHTALAWDTARREGQFRSALASRDVIGQAKGVLMANFDVDAVAAFDLLRRASQDSNTPLVDVAAQLAASPRFT